MPTKYHCAVCTRPVLGRSICRDCEKDLKRMNSRRIHHMSTNPRGLERMERT